MATIILTSGDEFTSQPNHLAAAAFLFSLILPIVVTPAQAQLAQPRAAPQIFDAKGRLVGPVIGTGPFTSPFGGGGEPMSVVTAFTVNQKFFAVHVLRDRFFGSLAPESQVWFASFTCDGTPYLPSNNNNESLVPYTMVAEPGSTVYRALPGAVPEVVEVNSILGFQGGCLQVSQGQQTGIAAEALINLAPLFTPPFTLR